MELVKNLKQAKIIKYVFIAFLGSIILLAISSKIKNSILSSAYDNADISCSCSLEYCLVGSLGVATIFYIYLKE